MHAFAATVDFNTLVQAEGEGRVCVGFCDLSGSTDLLNSSASLRAMEALAAFEVVANDLAVRHGGHVVKFVGDEVMYTVAAADDAIAVGRALLAWVADHVTLGSARVGIAIGAVTQRDGDLFGPTVNRAARLTAAAAPDTMLVDAALTEAGTPATVELRGFAESVAVRVLRTA
jgi:adenylate cyclase